MRYQRIKGLYFPPIKNNVALTGQLNWSFSYVIVYQLLYVLSFWEVSTQKVQS